MGDAEKQSCSFIREQPTFAKGLITGICPFLMCKAARFLIWGEETEIQTPVMLKTQIIPLTLMLMDFPDYQSWRETQ